MWMQATRCVPLARSLGSRAHGAAYEVYRAPHSRTFQSTPTQHAPAAINDRTWFIRQQTGAPAAGSRFMSSKADSMAVEGKGKEQLPTEHPLCHEVSDYWAGWGDEREGDVHTEYDYFWYIFLAIAACVIGFPEDVKYVYNKLVYNPERKQWVLKEALTQKR